MSSPLIGPIEYYATNQDMTFTPAGGVRIGVGLNVRPFYLVKVATYCWGKVEVATYQFTHMAYPLEERCWLVMCAACVSCFCFYCHGNVSY